MVNRNNNKHMNQNTKLRNRKKNWTNEKAHRYTGRIFHNFKLYRDKRVIRESIALNNRCFIHVELNIR